MLFLTQVRVNIGINHLADETTRHGVLWADSDATGEKRNIRVPFIADKPHAIKHGLNYATWRRLKHQIEKMGIIASHLELKIDGNHYCYQLDEYKELYARGRGTPLWRTVAI